MKTYLKFLGAAGALMLGTIGNASATAIGVLTEGSQGNSYTNLSYIVANNLITPAQADTVTSLSNSTFNSLSPSALAAAYDVLVMPWYVNPTANFDWSTRLLPYLNAGGSILWENPESLSSLSGSGLTLSTGNVYSASPSTIVLTSPFGDAGAEGYFHIHYSITGQDGTWNQWSVDGNGGIHGVNKVFANDGRMVLGVSDNLYHPSFSSAGDADHLQLTVNQINWLVSGSITGTPVSVPEPGSVALLGLGLAGLAAFRRKSAKSAIKA